MPNTLPMLAKHQLNLWHVLGTDFFGFWLEPNKKLFPILVAVQNKRVKSYIFMQQKLHRVNFLWSLMSIFKNTTELTTTTLPEKRSSLVTFFNGELYDEFMSMFFREIYFFWIFIFEKVGFITLWWQIFWENCVEQSNGEFYS